MTTVTLWWSALVLGTVLLVLSGVVPTIRQFRGRRVPRLGFAPPRGPGTPWWSWAALGVGIFLMSFASGQLSESGASNLTYFAGACATALVVQTIVIAWHNRQLRGSGPGGVASPGVGAGPAAS